MMDVFQIPIEIIKNVIAGVPLLRQLKEKHSKRRVQLFDDVDRFFDVFEKLLNLCDENLNIKDKVVLEIGPGNSLAIGLLFLACGAKKVFLVDRFKHLFYDDYDISFHRKVLERIKEKDFPFFSAASEAVIFTKGGSIDFDKDKIEYRLGNAANLPMKNNSIDIVFSNAVFEYVHDIKKAISEIGRVTKPSGLGIHEIDLRDHFFQSQPLRLLQYPDWLWNLMAWNRPGYTNRLRLSDFLKLFESYGFLIRKLVPTREYEGDILSLKVNRKFTDFSYEQLRALAFQVLLQKKDRDAT